LEDARLRELLAHEPGGDSTRDLRDDGALAHAGIAREQRRLAVLLEQGDNLGARLIEAVRGAELAVASERGQIALDELLQFVLAPTLALLLGHGADMIRGRLWLCPR